MIHKTCHIQIIKACIQIIASLNTVNPKSQEVLFYFFARIPPNKIIPDQFTVKTQEPLFPSICCHVTVCLCTNGCHHEGRTLASVTRCKNAKAVVKPFILMVYMFGERMKSKDLRCKQKVDNR